MAHEILRFHAKELFKQVDAQTKAETFDFNLVNRYWLKFTSELFEKFAENNTGTSPAKVQKK